MTKVIQVIETYELRGKGIDEDPIRRVYQLWTLDGNLIFEKDPIEETNSDNSQEIKMDTGLSSKKTNLCPDNTHTGIKKEIDKDYVFEDGGVK